MLPTQSDVHVDTPLTNFAQKFMQTDGFVFDKVFSSLPVDKASNKYYIYDKSDFWRDEGDISMLLAPGAPVKRGGYRLSTTNYSCDVRAYGKPVEKEVAANADAVINSDRDAVDFIMQKLMVRHENQFMTEFFTTSVWGTDLTPANLWSDYANSDPITDIKTTARLAIKSATGMNPNTLLVGGRVDAQLKGHPLVKEQFKYTSSDSISNEMLAALFEVERYLVADAVNTTSKEANATQTFDFIAGKHALLCYTAPDGSDGATAGRVFKWTGWGNTDGIAIQSYYEDQTRSNVYEGFTAIDNKVCSTALGYFFNGAVA